MKDQIVRIRFFTAVDYLEEELYLKEMHKKGYKLIQVFGRFFYVFEKCESEDVVYRIDFKGSKETDEYIKMAEDFNWEYITSTSFGFVYFRKEIAKVDNEEDLEFFSDDESRLNMVSSIVKKRLIPLGIMILMLNIPLFVTSISQKFATYYTLYSDILLFAIYAYVGIHSILKIRRMKRYGFKAEKSSAKFVKIVTFIVAICIFLPVPNVSLNQRICSKGLNRIEAKDYVKAYVTDVANEDVYLLKEDEVERLINEIFSDEFKKERYKARDTIENKQLFLISLYKKDTETSEEIAILENSIIICNLNKYVLEDNKDVNYSEIKNVLESAELLDKYIMHDNCLYVKTDVMTEGKIEELEVHFIETHVGLMEKVTKNEECNFPGDKYQIIDENTLNVAVYGKWFVFEKEE